VLIPLDGTPEAAQALLPAAALSSDPVTRLETITVAQPASTPEKMSRIDAQLRSTGVDVDRRIVTWRDEPVADLVARTLQEDEDAATSTLIVAASHSGSRLGALRMSFTERVLRSGGGPLLLVGAEYRRAPIPGGGVLLVAVSDPVLDRPLGTLVAAWADCYGFEVEFIHVDETATVTSIVTAGAYQENRRRIKESERLATEVSELIGSPVEFTRVADHDAARGIISRAEQEDVALIVMSSHTRSALAQAALGSIAIEVLNHAPCGVLLLRPESQLRQSVDPTQRQSSASAPVGREVGT